jgi:hypothetical protein
VFGPLTGDIGEKTFGSNEEVQEAVQERLSMQPKNSFLSFSDEFWHWGSTEGYPLKTTASMLKNDKAVPNIFAIN